MLDVDASSISLVLHEDREHAAVVDEGGKLWLVWNEGVLWNRTLVDAGPVTGEVEMAAVNGGVEIYTVIETNCSGGKCSMTDSSEAL